MAMREPKPPTFRDIALLSDRIAREKRAGKKPMRKKPSPSAGKMMGPKKPMRPKPKGSADIGENLPKFPSRPKKKPTSGSTSARIRNMEKKYAMQKRIKKMGL